MIAMSLLFLFQVYVPALTFCFDTDIWMHGLLYYKAEEPQEDRAGDQPANQNYLAGQSTPGISKRINKSIIFPFETWLKSFKFFMQIFKNSFVTTLLNM